MPFNSPQGEQSALVAHHPAQHVPAQITIIHQLAKRLRLRVNCLRSKKIDPAKLSSALLC